MHKFIIITSIFEPTTAVVEYSQQKDHALVVVGDKKTPITWQCENVTYLSIEKQDKLGFELSRYLPHNHYCRKMLGYLYAMSNKADIIIDTDDDNIPLLNWGFPEFSGNYRLVPKNMGFVNIYELFTKQKIWPRGYPLKFINKTNTIRQEDICNENVKIGIWQGLANEDPDVDAIYRLTNDQPVIFQENGPYVLAEGTATPFNSQNTAFVKELFVLLYLPAYVSFRFTDILRGLIAQPIMWLLGFNLGFTGATVIQKRNPHDYMKDFESEIPMYLYSEKTLELITACVSSNRTIDDNLYNAYSELNRNNIVSEKEMKCLEAWLSDIKKIRRITK